jgi:surface protein
MNLNNVNLIKLGNDSEVSLMKWNGYILYQKEQESIPLYNQGDFTNNRTIISVDTLVNESHTDLSNMFLGCYSLISVNTEDWNTGNVTNMTSMFASCHSLTSLNLSNFDTSKVVYMTDMFQFCGNLTELHLSGWDMSKVEYMNYMFEGCYRLYILDLSDCSKDTITKIITSEGFPTGMVNDVPGAGTVTRKLWCRQIDAPDESLLPSGWELSYVD